MNDRDKARNLRSPVFKLLGLTVVAVILFGGFAVTPSYGQAQTEHFKFRDDFQSSAVPACSPNEVFFTGRVQIDGQTTIGPDGELTHAHVHSNIHATGVDTEGNKWRMNEHEHQTLNPNGGVFGIKAHGTFISQGSGEDFNTIVNINFHTVTHPDGRITGEIDRVNVECTGQPGEP